MRSQPNRNYVSNDDVQTPLPLARQLVNHFHPAGRILEPCCGEGAFLKALQEHIRSGSATGAWATVQWAEIKQGRDFYAWQEPVDWIITNPPWSQIRHFLQHAMEVADHVVFLITINHVWTKARLRDVKAAGFGLREIVLVDMPANFPPSGFQLGAVRLSRGYVGPVEVTDLTASGWPPGVVGLGICGTVGWIAWEQISEMVESATWLM